MKLDFERREEAVERLKKNLRVAVEHLSDRESPTLVNDVVRNVAKLVKMYGERSLKEQCDSILSLARNDDVWESRCLWKGRNREDNLTDLDRDLDRMNQANRDIMDKMGSMRSAVRMMEEKRLAEMKLVLDELERCKHILADTEKRLDRERMCSRRLKKQLAKKLSCRSHSSASEESDIIDDDRFGFGALTVRSFTGTETCRPTSAKSRKHRRD